MAPKLRTNLDMTCSGAPIIHFLKDTYRKSNNTTYVTSILSDNYIDMDINIMKSQLKIDFPIIHADNELSKKRDEMINKYNAEMLSDIVFITDSSGNILNISHKKCNCYGAFINNVNNIITGQKGGK